MRRPIVLTLVVRDEIDVIETCLAYHLGRGVDLVLVTDHRSVDGTTDVLRAFERRGLARVWRQEGEAFAQGAWVTHMARVAAREHDAAWIVHGDADEFFWPVVGDLRTTLAATPAGVDVLAVPRTNFLPTRDESAPFHARMLMRDLSAQNALGGPLPPKVCHRACADVAVDFGNHAVRCPHLGPAAPALGMEILHYPVRSWRQIERKILQGAAALAAVAGLPETTGLTWRRLSESHAAGGLRAWWETQVRLGEAAEPTRCVRDARLADWMR